MRQLSRKPYPLPVMKAEPGREDSSTSNMADFTLENYQAARDQLHHRQGIRLAESCSFA